jgi:hypothetical protein
MMLKASKLLTDMLIRKTVTKYIKLFYRHTFESRGVESSRLESSLFHWTAEKADTTCKRHSVDSTHAAWKEVHMNRMQNSVYAFVMS